MAQFFLFMFCHYSVTFSMMTMTQLFRYFFLLLVWAIYFKCVCVERGEKSGLNKQERSEREPSGGPFSVHYIINVIGFFFVIYETEYMAKGVKIEERRHNNKT